MLCICTFVLALYLNMQDTGKSIIDEISDFMIYLSE